MSDVIVKYRIQKHCRAVIDRCTFARQTDKFLLQSDGRRHTISSKFEQYFDTWAEAHAALTEIADKRVLEALRDLELANSYADNVRGMKEPV